MTGRTRIPTSSKGANNASNLGKGRTAPRIHAPLPDAYPVQQVRDNTRQGTNKITQVGWKVAPDGRTTGKWVTPTYDAKPVTKMAVKSTSIPYPTTPLMTDSIRQMK